METKGNGKKKKSGFGKGCLITLLALLLVVGVAGGIGWAMIEAEHREVRSLPLNAVDFKKLNDGVYIGEYAGGMYQWRTNKSKVTVANGLVSDIELLQSAEFESENNDLTMLYDRVIASQTLQVDTISGATLTSKAHLQSIENALLQAQYQ